ncbi:hypothetical protein [Actinoplanes rectilineatus]|uniref:hypothetical protein n=1 Tax=Actinoplanes rectilineatus TaxID=113571 RepID=UPI000ACAA319|nr:hypothetical protein [Actinoplanes rectilineatus]
MNDNRLGYFSTDAVDALDFLGNDFGFEGPQTPESGYVGFASGRWAIWAVLEERNKTVDTFVNYDMGERVLSASVWGLVRKAKLKGAGQPQSSAITRLGMQKSLTAQARALRIVLPLLFAEGGAGLMER